MDPIQSVPSARGPVQDPPALVPLNRPARLLLVAFGALTALAVVALLLGAEHTGEAFAWTITPPLGAAFLGAAYGSGCVLVVLTLRAATWEQARWPLATILVFVTLTLVATLLHLDRMHLPGETRLATAAGWFWLAVYVVLPVVMAVVMAASERAYRRDRRARRVTASTAPRAFTASLLGQAAVLAGAGVLLAGAAGPVFEHWPWALTPLLARVTAAWLLAFALAGVLATRVHVALLGPAAAGYAAFGGLELLAVALHADDLRPGVPATVFVLVATWVLLTGGWGVWLARSRTRGPQPSGRPADRSPVDLGHGA